MAVAMIAVPLTAAAQSTATVTANAPIYVTHTPTADQTPLRVAATGTTLHVLAKEGEWLQVEFRDPQWGRRVGWVDRKYLSTETPASPRSVSTVKPARGTAPGAPPTKATHVIEWRDAPLQRSWFTARKAPRDCNHMSSIPGQVCWTVQSVAWRNLNKEQKGIYLSVNVWGDSSSGLNVHFAALTLAIDGRVIELPATMWDHSLAGETQKVNDESIVRAIAGAQEVWFTAMANPRASQKLSLTTLENIRAVLAAYDGLDTTTDRLQQLNRMVSELMQRMAHLVERGQAIQADQQSCGDFTGAGPAVDRCVSQLKDLATETVEKGEAIVTLLDEMMMVLNGRPQDAATSEAKKQNAEMRTQMSSVIGIARQWLADHQK